MTARYYRAGHGHSLRGDRARELGGRAWSRIPAALRRGLTSDQAARLGISAEWHHAGKHADRVHVYYGAQVARFWEVLDAHGVTADEALASKPILVGGETAEEREEFTRVSDALRAARAAAEDVRLEITED